MTSTGRYFSFIEDISKIFNEENYYFERVRVELAYLSILLKKKHININININNNIDINKILEIEKTTKHDVKAIEYYIRTITDKNVHNYIHCGLTSQDVNSVGYILMLENSRDYFNQLFNDFNTI